MNYYLSSRQDQKLREVLLKDFTASERVGSIIANSEMSKKYNELLTEYMTRLLRQKPEEFNDNFVKLNFGKDEAKIEFSTLLNTYRIVNPWLKIKSRSFEEELKSDYNGESLQFPFGKKVIIEIMGETHRNIVDFLKVHNQAAFTFEIDITTIQKITGSIDKYFEVFFAKGIIRFDYTKGISFISHA